MTAVGRRRTLLSTSASTHHNVEIQPSLRIAIMPFDALFAVRLSAAALGVTFLGVGY
ncbi:MAG: hypothetical protein ABEJ79_05000 [Halolamina sp.]